MEVTVNVVNDPTYLITFKHTNPSSEGPSLRGPRGGALPRA